MSLQIVAWRWMADKLTRQYTATTRPGDALMAKEYGAEVEDLVAATDAIQYAEQRVSEQLRTIESLNAVINDAGSTTTENLSIVGRMEVQREADERLLREAMEALGACRKKGARWHPCDPVATASDAAIAALRKRLGE